MNRTRRNALLAPALALALTWACKHEEAAPPAAQSAERVPAGRPAGPAGPTRMEKDLLGEKVSALPRVDVIFVSVDMSPDLINAAANGAKGIVIAGVGNGNMNKASVDAAAAVDSR